jgi:hypothetical protein
MRRWFENRLARLLATAYVAARARAIAALPHDEFTCGGGPAQARGGTERRGPETRNINSWNANYTRYR